MEKELKDISIENQLIIKYLKHQLTEEESALIIDWLQSDHANRDFLFSLEELYWADQMEEMRQLADTNREWAKLEARILQSQQPRKISLGPRSILKYAAIFLLALSLPFFAHRMGFFTQHYTQNTNRDVTVVTEKGGRSQILLPDGSKVWINTCSSLTYNADFSSTRQIKLSGEAYFEVAKDERRPFTVSTSLIDIKVLGTKFNLKAFEDENEVQATLYEGSISANTPDAAFQKDILLKPGEQLIYNKNKMLSIITIGGTNDIKWKDGIFYFKKQTLQSIVRGLERNFNVTIAIEDEKLAREEFTGEFENAESLTDILEILKMTKKLDYRINGSHVRIVSAK